jgi:hypothetical protein
MNENKNHQDIAEGPISIMDNSSREITKDKASTMEPQLPRK